MDERLVCISDGIGSVVYFSRAGCGSDIFWSMGGRGGKEAGRAKGHDAGGSDSEPVFFVLDVFGTIDPLRLCLCMAGRAADFWRTGTMACSK